MKPATPDACRLFHEAAIALAQVESNGFQIDIPYLDNAIVETEARIRRLIERLKQCDEWKIWKRRFGVTANIGSREQLGVVLFKEMGHTPQSFTATGKDQMNELALERINTPFTRNLTKLFKLEKAVGTYLRGIRREVGNDGLLHAFFNLHTTTTFRSSSSDVNFQNQPIRDPLQGALIRTAFIPRPGQKIIELDFSGAEVCIAACYHKDPTMLKYLAEGYDMHRDMGAECYKLPMDRVPKKVRQQAKALFVFSQFYGDYYLQCAKNLWGAIALEGLTTQDGICLYEHLAAQGISERGDCDPKKHDPTSGSFEEHIKAVESNFWGVRFAVYNQWRKDWYAAYQRDGGFNTLTGFAVHGVFDRNFVINCPVQGSAFHCLLWCLIQLQKWLRKNRMRSMIVGQIHDSIVLDVHPSEEAEVLAKAKELMTSDIVEHWPWIITGMKIEAGGSTENWWSKKEIAI